MTELMLDASHPLGFLDSIGEEVDAIASAFGCDCIVESTTGAVVAHAVRDQAPQSLTEAVLRRKMTAVYHASSNRRTIALSPSGPVESLRLDEVRALVLPLVSAHARLGWCWLVGSPPRADDVRLPALIRSLEDALRTPAEPRRDGLISCLLTGQGPLPSAFSGQLLHVARVISSDSSAGLPHALRRSAPARVRSTITSAVCAAAHGTYLLLEGDTQAVVNTVDSWLRRAEQGLGSVLSAAVVGPTASVTELPRLVRDADTVLNGSSRKRGCVPLPIARQVLIHEHLGAAIDSLPSLGPDPLKDLLDYDSRKPLRLAESLLAWLEAAGDLGSAAEQLDVHPNTLRYRLRRARDLLIGDLDDPALRLETHLRLRRIRAHAIVQRGKQAVPVD